MGKKLLGASFILHNMSELRKSACKASSHLQLPM